MIKRLFISATGTSAGKTFVSRGLTAALTRIGLRVAALKPLETGCEPEPLDAIALAKAARSPQLAYDPAFYRVRPPLSPYAATLGGEAAPSFDAIIRRIGHLASEHDHLIVEGAGGLLVPLDRHRDMTALVAALDCKLLVIAPNRLGVLSHALTTVESARARGLELAGLVLTEPDAAPDHSSRSNLQILRERLSLPIFSFPQCRDDDEALADAAVTAGLIDLIAPSICGLPVTSPGT
jgi:dethiobiotin synthetase